MFATVTPCFAAIPERVSPLFTVYVLAPELVDADDDCEEDPPEDETEDPEEFPPLYITSL